VNKQSSGKEGRAKKDKIFIDIGQNKSILIEFPLLQEKCIK